MDISEFRSGQPEQQYEYQSFLPRPINQQWIVSAPAIATILEEANRLLGELNAFSQLIPDVDFFIRMHITKEATTSSRIEGTQTNIEEALIDKLDVNPEKRDDWQEVHNYIDAINFAIKRLSHIPLSNRLLRETHAILLRGVRGKHKQPGEFRTSQNWIGVSLKHASFVLPHHSHVPALMTDLETFIHNDQIHVPHLVKIALIHYQFETIHPFLDGNGRLGRLLIVLYLVHFGLLHKPALYLSDFFERHKGEYYDQLMAVRTTHKLEPWLRFFLLGLRETTGSSIQVFKDILQLKERIERKHMPAFHVRRQANAQALMRSLYKTPATTIKNVTTLIQTQTNTAAALVDDFVKLGILKEFTGQKRNRLFIFEEYVRLFKR
ncbi:MAG TPA: Fic/DOC family N-terminal domain-containing protein [Nitrospira sp.]|nr:Fic/DOC family N-terminal domain-containing protein [Nitrospira sp.]